MERERPGIGRKGVESQEEPGGGPPPTGDKDSPSHPGSTQAVTCPRSRRIRAANSASWRGTHTHKYTQPRRVTDGETGTDKERQVKTPTETQDKEMTKRDMKRMKVSLMTGQRPGLPIM